MPEFIINLDDQQSLQNNPALHSQVQVDVDRDANPERRGTLMPSELVMGPGKPYQAHVAFKDPSRATRWRGKDTDKSGGAIVPWVGTNIQYTLVNTPNGEHDGQMIGEFIMTMVSEFNKTCSAQAFLQGVGAWNPKNPPRTNAEYINLIESVVARGPVMGIHTDWEGQEVAEDAQGNKTYTKIDGLNSWRSFPMAQGAPGTRPMPVPRIPILDKDGKETGRSYVASSRVVRREPITPSSAPVLAQSGLAQYQAQAPPNPYGQAPPQGNPYAAPMPPPQQFASPQQTNGQYGSPNQQFVQAPMNQFAQQPNFAPQPPNLGVQHPQYAPPQQAAYVPPQPLAQGAPGAPPQAPTQTSGQFAQGQPQQPNSGQATATQGAQAWQQPGPSFR